MKKITFILLLFAFTYQLQAQKQETRIQKIGLKSHFRLAFTDLTFGAGLGGNLEYNRSFYNQKHFLSSGIGVHLTNMERPITIDNNHEKPWDHSTFISVPIHYIYQPFTWFYVRTGFNNNLLAFRNLAPGNDLLWTNEDIPDYNKFIVEYHAGVGLEIPIKRVLIRLEAFLNYAILTSEYNTQGLSLGAFYKFK